MEEMKTLRIGKTTYEIVDAKAREEISKLSGGNVDGLSDTAKALLITILRNAVYSSDQSANITALEKALATGGSETPDEPVNPDKTLTSISATYSGGNVPVGTSVLALTGIVVTAHYSDGSAATVTGYTLSGTIAEGSNTVTVIYGGKTTTFAVTGVSESGGDTPSNLLYNWDLTKSLVDTVSGNQITLSDGTTQSESGLTISASKGYATIPDMTAMGAFTMEVDVADVDWVGTNHGRFIMTEPTHGFIYRSSGKWAMYGGSGWVDGTVTDVNAFDGKTLKFVFSNPDAKNRPLNMAVYDGDTLITEDGTYYSADTAILIGSASSSLYNVTITAIRVYEGV